MFVCVSEAARSEKQSGGGRVDRYVMDCRNALPDVKLQSLKSE